MTAENEWLSLIDELKKKQSLLLPGNSKILDIASLIQEIEGRILADDNHATYLLYHPEERQGLAQRAKEKALILISEP